MKPWHTKEWKEMRSRRIGDKCEQCDSINGPFVLQHFSHYKELSPPPLKNTVVWNLMREYDAYPPRPNIQRPACPKCKKRGLTKRRSMNPTCRCIGCHHEFDDPLTVQVPVDSRTGKEEYAQYGIERWEAFNEFLASNQDEVEKRYDAALAE